MMSVLVTGATHPVGRQLVHQLLSDARVGHVLASGRHGDPAPLPNHARLSHLPLDLTKSREVHDVLFGPARDLGVEVVVHLGRTPDPWRRGRSAHAGDVEAVRSILDLSDRHPTIRRVVILSHAVVYRVGLDLPILVTEDHPLNLDPRSPQVVRDRVEADLTACARMGLADCEIVVLRCAEALEVGTGGQLVDYLSAPLALRPLGFDPMINVATVQDLVASIDLATFGHGEGVFNIPGYDTLPLTAAADLWGTPTIPAPGRWIEAAYAWRHRLTGSRFSWGLNRQRLHFGLVLDGTRARDAFGYVPRNPVAWPRGSQRAG